MHDRIERAQAAKDRYMGKQPQYCYAVTGTCGKTSTCFFLYQLFCLLGYKAAYIGTLGIYNNAGYTPTAVPDLTTFSPDDTHKTLAELADAGVTHVALEASSHGLDQDRLYGVSFYGIAFTNLSREHLDYHADMEAYFAAKKRLFTDFSPTLSVANADDPYGAQLPATIRFGRGTDYYYENGFIWIKGQAVDVKTLAIIGDFQYWNVCCAVALLPEHDVLPLLSAIQPAPGRFEKVHNAPLVIIDYAHKPEAVSVVLKALHRYTKGRIITVFGCGGNRDTGKRPIMGEIANVLSDVVIVTDDNPRHEDPSDIRQQILAGCPNAIEIGDRADAIRYAITIAKPEDSVAILGKGQEKYQKIKDEKIPFDDCEVARHACLS